MSIGGSFTTWAVLLCVLLSREKLHARLNVKSCILV